jgi:hypothetical protein
MGWPSVLLASTSHMYIGAESDLIDQFFPGKIDDVRIYNRKLSATEIETLYNLVE